MLTILKASLDCGGDRGLLEDYSSATNHFVCVYNTGPVNYIHMRVSRFTFSGNLADSSEVLLLELGRAENTGNHYGGQIDNKEKYSPRFD